MTFNILYKSHEELFLSEGFKLALQFKEGWVVFRILGREPSNVKPYQIARFLASESYLASWDEVIDAQARRYLEPPTKDYIYHTFWGISPPPMRVYFQYPTRRARWSLVEVERALGGSVGYIDGEMSPYAGPFSAKTEIFTIEDLYPAFNVYNPLSRTVYNVVMNFDVMKYSFHVITDRELIKDCLTQRVRCKMYTMGGIVDPSPAEIPEWLEDIVGSELLEYSVQVSQSD